MASLNPAALATPSPTTKVQAQDASAEGRRALRDSLIVTVGGQISRVVGTITALAMKWGLDPASLGVYTGLRLFYDNTNRSSLGISVGAVQEIPILRAAGREADAQRVANVAFTTNTLTCLAYALGLVALALWWAPLKAGDPLAAEWTWGLIAFAGLAIGKRYQDFLIAVHRAHQRFVLTTELTILDSMVFALLVIPGLWLAGFWGLLGAIAGLLAFNIVYLHARHPLRFQWAWNRADFRRLFRVGLPILANTAVFTAVLSLDRILILWLIPDGERSMGLYTIALMGTGWSLDLAGRIATVMYTYFQTTLGRTKNPVEVARQAARVTEAQAPLLAAGSAVAYLVGPVFLGLLVPRYAEGLSALRPLLPGMLLLGLAWPARQALITVERPFRLATATLLGLALTATAGAIGADRAGIVGVAWGMSIGYASVYLLTATVAFSAELGGRAWLIHQGRVFSTVAWYAAGAILAAHLPLPELSEWPTFAIRCSLLCAWGLPTLWLWGRRHGWGGIFERRKRATRD
ncbi:hypothetical protein BH23PLA1_BH23PLA1_29900 [soil metagenome]